MITGTGTVPILFRWCIRVPAALAERAVQLQRCRAHTDQESTRRPEVHAKRRADEHVGRWHQVTVHGPEQDFPPFTESTGRRRSPKDPTPRVTLSVFLDSLEKYCCK